MQPSYLESRSADGSQTRANPITFLMAHYMGLVNPRFPNWALALLVILAICHGIIVLSCIVIMLLPAWKGRESRKRHYFLARRIYSQEFRGMPYLVPNRSMVIVFGELCSGVLYVVCACFNYWVVTQPEMPEGANLSLWYSIALLPSYMGIWMAGWGLAYACFCHIEGTNNRRPYWILTPRVYNLIWISWPIVIIVVISYLAGSSDHYYNALMAKINNLYRQTQAAAVIWNLRGNLSNIPMSSMLTELREIYVVLDKWSSEIVNVAKFWTGIECLMAFFYIATVWYLLRLLRQVLTLADSDLLAPKGKFKSVIWIEMEAEFRYLLRSSFFITTSIFFQMGVMIFHSWAMSPTNIQVPEVKILIALLDQLPGITLAPSLLFQAWRIMAERSAADEATFWHVQLEFSNGQTAPQMASQLLGWDTTEHWGERLRTEAAPFPGLLELGTSTDVLDKTPGRKIEGTVNDHVIVTRTIEVIEETA